MTSDMHPDLVNGKLFSAFAKQSPEIWMALNGAYLLHTERGEGTIEEINPRNGNPLISVRFEESGERTLFNAESFNMGRISVDVPPTLRPNYTAWKTARDAEEKALKEEQEREVAHRAELERRRTEIVDKYRDLVDKLGGPEEELVEDGRETPFGSILKKLGSRSGLDESDLAWLENRGLYRFVALHFYYRNKTNSDLWDLVKTCKYLRRASLPERAIQISEKAENNNCDSRAWSALQTSRGGAYRDVGNLTEAKHAAYAAISSSPNSYHPYMLLGAVFYDDGDYIEGDKHFHRAEELGASARTRDFEIRATLEKSSHDERNRLVQHLLTVDEERYNWARRYAG